MSADVRDTLARIDDRLRQSLVELAGLWPEGGELPCDDLVDLWGDTLTSGGKRFRPQMCHWGWVCAGGAAEIRGHQEMILAGTALELLHAFALIHDDVMDDSEVRRGAPTVRAVLAARHSAGRWSGDSHDFGDAMAVLVGDLGHSEVGVLVGQLPEAMRREWRAMSVELVAGQARDLTGAADRDRDLDHARSVARAKSGGYTIARPLRLGALAGGGGPAVLDVLTEVGVLLGEAFALRDDLLGVWGTAEETGKPVGDDLSQGKATVLLALAERAATPSLHRQLARVGGGLRAEEIATLTHALEEIGVKERAEALVVELVAQAIALLDSPVLDPDGAAGLRSLANLVAWRVV